ncbi:hypothetical protein DRW41_22090 [Neobacillus piezotolerans]|uniref:DUF4062 domain-containing protein n=1 Tax=Neobacillus piezotolerans TaxID=2259171 RepID=A0A3D8GJX4_9BACI|nr:DUF4062 domain-containing protein [Neobacillus piezotolerans]RDU34718.1 hypothetical protein DRW41_22090 [Neobacillus piezotolerans]
MDKKYQVFISSTFKDLQDARQKVMDTILELHQIPAGMEMFPAADADQWSHIKSEIDRSDYYILILGHRYGSIGPDGISFTEMEYDYAREQNIPVLAFIMDRDVPVKLTDLDNSSTAKKRLEKFIAKAQQNKLCKSWSTIDDLATKVSTSLAFSFTTNPRLGWVRGNQAVSSKAMEELANLSKENRALKVKIEALKKVNEKKPIIKFNFNRSGPLELYYQRELKYSSLRYPEEISFSEIPDYLLDYLDKENVENYNNNLLNIERVIKKYNNELEFYTRAHLNGLEVKMSVSNLGEIKGNNVYVELTFPSSVWVIEEGKEEMAKPSVPVLPKNPVTQAQKKYDDSRLDPVDKLLRNMNQPIGLVSPRLDFTRDYSPLINNRDSVLNNNIVTIHIKELLHTRTFKLDDVYTLVPKSPGEFEVKVSIICEEYSKQEQYTIPLIIHER